MSELSEEEIIKILQHYLEMEEFDNAGDFLVAIDKILDLYQKEKEKNKELAIAQHIIETQKAEIDAKEFDIEALKEERENDINKIDKLQIEIEERDIEINRLKNELGYTRKVVEGEKKDGRE